MFAYRFRLAVLLPLVFLTVVVSPALGAGPAITAIYPPGGQRGTELEIELTGTFAAWPIKVQSPDALQWELLEKKGQAKVRVAANATPGVHWVRFYDEQGAAELKPFVVGTLPDVAENNANDALAKAQPIERNCTVYGKYDASGDTDTYALQLKAGATLICLIEANATHGAPADAVLQILDERGFVLNQIDDRYGLDPQIAFDVPADGTYYVRTFCFPAKPNSTIRFAGGADHIYRLTLTTGPTLNYVFPLSISREVFDSLGQANHDPAKLELFGWNLGSASRQPTVVPSPAGWQPGLMTAFSQDVDRAVPLLATDLKTQTEQEPNNATAQANPMSVPLSINGELSEPDDVDLYRLTVEEPVTWKFQVQSATYNFPVDARLRILDSEGEELKSLDDERRGRTLIYDPMIEQAFRTPGDYFVEISDLFGRGMPGMIYSLTIEPARPEFRLSVAADHFEAAAGGKLEIPVTVERVNRLPGEIKVSATGLPDGVKVEPVVSEVKGATAKSVKLVLQADSPISSGFQIVGETVHEEAAFRETAQGTLPTTTQVTPDLWLTIQPKKAEKKEDAAKDK